MQLAIGEARAAAARGEIPVGAIVVVADRVVGRGHNLTETLRDWEEGIFAPERQRVAYR